MSNCCHTKEPQQPQEDKQKVTPGCCPSEQGADSGRSHPDYLLWGSGLIVLTGYILYWLLDGHPDLPRWLVTMTSGIYELINTMWWGLLMAVIFVGLLERVPRELVMSALGQGGTAKGIVRATLAGVLLDLCSHGILMVGTKLYERGASLGQLMAFLIASPWNSLSLTIIMIALIGFQWTLAYILLSMAIGIVSGIIFDRIVARGVLPANPNQITLDGDSEPVGRQLLALIKSAKFTPKGMTGVLLDGIRDSRMVFRWLLFGIVLATLIRAFVPMDAYQTLFGPTVVGLLLTLIAATVIEVCSEGSTPIAADLVTRAAAPGNGFTFLMAGVATDYTEIMVIRDLTRSWKVALFLPLVTLPQVLVLGWVLNQF
ncbi:MAG: permease [Porticoccaceae bacterium]|nr:permease [Pseudomonadales bacterium]MCP5171402.1 permease [Pseudomonadales bacterium]